jgi:hypothetical protein
MRIRQVRGTGRRACFGIAAKQIKVFWFFFCKKERYYVANATTASPVDNHSDRPRVGSTNSLKLNAFLKTYPQPVDSNENLLHCSQYVPLNRRPDVDHKCEAVDVGPSRAAGGRPVAELSDRLNRLLKMVTIVGF